MATVEDITDYIISRLAGAGGRLTQLKLQKLLYYVQSWHLACHGSPIAPAKFQAWVHGPVSREVFDRFRASKMLYSSIEVEDMRPGFNSEKALAAAERELVDAVLEAYGSLTGDQLEQMTHREEPWIKARGGRGPDERCETEIDESLMGEYYRRRLKT